MYPSGIHLLGIRESLCSCTLGSKCILYFRGTWTRRGLNETSGDILASGFRVPQVAVIVNPEGPYTLPMELGTKKTIPILVFGT